MSIDIGQALGLIGGSPIAKAGVSYVEKLKHAKSMDGGGLGSLLSGLMSGGLGSIMKNPMAALTGQLQTAVAGAISQVSSLISGGGSSDSGGASSTPTFPLTLSALQGTTGLAAAAQSFAASTAGLAGTGAAPAGGYGLLDLLQHANTIDVLGPNPPTAYSVATAASPLTSQSLLQAATSQLEVVMTGIVALTANPNAVSPDDATVAAAVAAITTALQAVLSASNNAIGGLRTMLPALATASALGAALAQASSVAPGDPTFAALLQTIIQPAALIVLQEQAAAMMEY